MLILLRYFIIILKTATRKKKVIIKMIKILGPSMNGISHAIRSLHKPNPSPPFDKLKIINKG